MTVRSEGAAPYRARSTSNDAVVAEALRILDSRLRTQDEVHVTSPADTRNYLRLQLAEREAEVFCVVFLTNRHRVIAFEEMFHGTIDGATVHPREVVKAALRLNAAAVIFAHNHPSGVVEPSRADEAITRRLTDALALVDVRVLDHLIVGGSEITSLAERGLL
jgi:DNA repair protein RadC